MRKEQISRDCPVEELFEIYKESELEERDKEDEFDIYMGLWREYSIARVGTEAGLLSTEDIWKLFQPLNESGLDANALCQILPSWYYLATKYNGLIDVDNVAMSWLHQIKRLTDLNEQLRHWSDYLYWVKPERTAEIAFELERLVLADFEAADLLDVSRLVGTAKNLGVDLTELDQRLLTMVNEADLTRFSGNDLYGLIIHAERSELRAEDIVLIGRRYEEFARGQKGGATGSDGTLRNVFKFYLEQGHLEAAMAAFNKIKEKYTLLGATADLIEYGMLHGERMVTLEELMARIDRNDDVEKFFLHGWFLRALFLSEHKGELLDTEEALTAVEGGEVDTWLSSLAETLAKPEIKEKAPKMLETFLKRLQGLIAVSGDHRNTKQVITIEALIKAKVAGLI